MAMKVGSAPTLTSKSSTLADDVFEQLRASIVKGELTPGSKITEPRLSKQHGISRGPLREAIRRLEGCKLVEIKPNVGANIVSLDISKDALEVAEINAKSNNCKNINFLEMDFLSEIPDGRFDSLISNPPYIPQKEIENIMPEVKNYEPRIALTDFEEGLNFYFRIAKVGRTLIPNGIIILEVGLGNHPQKVFSLFKEAGFDQLELIKDYNNNERILKINI